MKFKPTIKKKNNEYTLTTHRGRELTVTKHAIDRARQRFYMGDSDKMVTTQLIEMAMYAILKGKRVDNDKEHAIYKYKHHGIEFVFRGKRKASRVARLKKFKLITIYPSKNENMVLV